MSSNIISMGTKTFGGSPPGDNNMEARVASLEAHVAHIQRDVDEIKTDLKTVGGKVDKINLRLAYATGALFGGSILVGWLISGRLDKILQIVQALQ